MVWTYYPITFANIPNHLLKYVDFRGGRSKDLFECFWFISLICYDIVCFLEIPIGAQWSYKKSFSLGVGSCSWCSWSSYVHWTVREATVDS